eukprot:466047_1
MTFDKELNSPEYSVGTGTVIHITKKNVAYVITAAHNYFGTLRQCSNSAHPKTLKTNCLHCNERTKTIQKIKATTISFQRRHIRTSATDDSGGTVDKSYPIKMDEMKILPEYTSNSQPQGGYDLAVMVFDCDDVTGQELYSRICPNICLFSDSIHSNLNDAPVSLKIYGFPGDKYQRLEGVEPSLRRCAMYGMETDVKKKHNAIQIMVSTHKRTGKLYISNRKIDTQQGQSGAVIYSYYPDYKNCFVIYGVHTGGNEAAVRRKSTGRNYGTLLDDEWTEKLHEWIPGKNIENHNDFIKYLVACFCNQLCERESIPTSVIVVLTSYCNINPFRFHKCDNNMFKVWKINRTNYEVKKINDYEHGTILFGHKLKGERFAFRNFNFIFKFRVINGIVYLLFVPRKFNYFNGYMDDNIAR